MLLDCWLEPKQLAAENTNYKNTLHTQKYTPAYIRFMRRSFICEPITCRHIPVVCGPLPGEWTSSPGAGSGFSPGVAPPSGGTGKDAGKPGSGAAPRGSGTAAAVSSKPAGSPPAFQSRVQRSPALAAERPRCPSGIGLLYWEQTCSFSKTPWPGRRSPKIYQTRCHYNLSPLCLIVCTKYSIKVEAGSSSAKWKSHLPKECFR